MLLALLWADCLTRIKGVIKVERRPRRVELAFAKTLDGVHCLSE